MSDARFDELVRLSEGELTSRRAAELEKELETSPELQATQVRVAHLVDALSREDPALEGVDLREGLWTREAPPRRVSRRAWWAAGAALAAALLLVVAATQAGDDDVRVKGGGGAPAGFEVFVLRDGRTQPLGPTLHADDALGFAYRNLPDSPYRALMLYAVDANGRTFWFYPAWDDAQRPPKSVPIGTSAGRVELPDAVRHALAPGRLVVHALFSREPLGVVDVEAGRVPSEGALSLTVEAQVLP